MHAVVGLVALHGIALWLGLAHALIMILSVLSCMYRRDEIGNPTPGYRPSMPVPAWYQE